MHQALAPACLSVSNNPLDLTSLISLLLRETLEKLSVCFQFMLLLLCFQKAEAAEKAISMNGTLMIMEPQCFFLTRSPQGVYK